jgi:hypothetical protein
MFMNERKSRVTYGLTVSEKFTSDRLTSEGLIKDAIAYWKRYELSPVKKLLKESGWPLREKGSFSVVLEGGTLWTEDFNKYKKVVILHFLAKGSRTEVLARMELPYAWYVSSKEREKASEMIAGFHDYLEKAPKLIEDYVKEAEAELG